MKKFQVGFGVERLLAQFREELFGVSYSFKIGLVLVFCSGVLPACTAWWLAVSGLPATIIFMSIRYNNSYDNTILGVVGVI